MPPVALEGISSFLGNDTRPPERVIESPRESVKCSGWPKTNPSRDNNAPRALGIDRLLVSQSTYRDVQAFRLGNAADLLGFASRLRNESGHNLWL